MEDAGYACSKEWLKMREKHLASLAYSRHNGKIDHDIIRLLDILNRNKCLVTTSSCSGRVVVITANDPHNKKEGVFIFRKHGKIELKELETIIKSAEDSKHAFTWLSIQPIIISMYVCGYANAMQLFSMFSSIGFKYTCVRATRIRGVYHLLVTGTERLDIPLIFKGITIINNSMASLIRLSELINTFISFSKAKLERLNRIISLSPLLLKCETR